MLTDIHIRDLATIQALDLSLPAASTVITGETGAGKSIFIEAIELALGGRASPNIIRPAKEKAEITLAFDISGFPAVMEFLKSIDLDAETNECLIRRVITHSGPSRSYINGSLCPLQQVKELGELLFHLHGQHEQQVLLKSETQRDMLDQFADTLPLVASLKIVAAELKSLDKAISTLQQNTIDREKSADYLHFQLKELQAIALQPGEWEKLEIEHRKLAHAETLIHDTEQALQLLSADDEKMMLSNLHHLRKTLETIHAVEPKAAAWVQNLESVMIQLEDMAAELRDYLEAHDLNQEHAMEIETRVSEIFNLSRKHKIAPAALAQLQIEIEAEWKALHHSDETLAIYLKEQKTLHEKYQSLAERLSKSREKAAKKFAKIITHTIRSLSLPHGEFRIELEKERETFSAYGNEKIIFKIKTYPDQALQALAKVISGGELSRLSLAAHLALAHRTSIPTLVFDEIDTGLSGATAEKIGKLLRELGNTYQVFCVTHQAQVAACCHEHILVEKYIEENKTHTRLSLLDTKSRTQEIARMLGGEKITKKTLAHATEILWVEPVA